VREDEYTIVDDVVGPGEPGDSHHLVDYQTQELVSLLWSIYLAKAREGLTKATWAPAMRRVSYMLDSESFAGQPMQRGIKVLSRSRRSCVFGADLWHADDGRMVHRAELVTVFVDPTQGGAIEIPADFWAEVEKLEGREIPVTERA
jgi:acyl-CoA thioesterase FadM